MRITFPSTDSEWENLNLHQLIIVASSLGRLEFQPSTRFTLSHRAWPCDKDNEFRIPLILVGTVDGESTLLLFDVVEIGTAQLVIGSDPEFEIYWVEQR